MSKDAPFKSRTAAWERAELQARTAGLRFRQRMDLVLAAAAGGVVVLLFLVMAAVWLWRNRQGWDARPLVQPVADARVLTNLRTPPAPFLDAVAQGEDVWLLQSGNRVHRRHLPTGLWTTEQPFAPEALRLNRLHADDAGPAGPSAPSALWALSEGGGLVRRTAQGWRTLMADTRFTDADGKGFAGHDLSAAAASDDGRLLLFGTKFDGVGLYDTTERRWLPRPIGLPAGTFVTHVAWWQGFFWIGGPSGLYRLDPTTGEALGISPAVQVRDLDADPAGALYVLGRQGKEPCTDCVWFGRFDAPTQPPTALLDEQTVFPDLDMVDLHFAAQQGDRLILAGRAGMYAYHTALHTWRRLYDKDVTVAHAVPGGRVFFAGPGLLGVLADDTILTWPVDDEEVISITSAPDGTVLALTYKGTVFRLTSGNAPEAVFTGLAGTADRRYTNGVALGDEVFLVGPEGATLHHVARRTYRDLNKTVLPMWLHQPATRLVTSGDTVYIMRDAPDGLRLYTWPAAAMANFNAAGLDDPITMPIPRTTPRDWEGNGLVYTAMDGRVLSYTAAGMSTWTGAVYPDAAGRTIHDATDWRNHLVLAVDGGVVVYDGTTRGFSNLYETADPVVETLTAGTRLLMRTAAGKLHAAESPDQVTQKRTLIGGRRPFPFDTADISDGTAAGDGLYFAGKGQVAHYDMRAREVLQTWDTGTGAPVTLAGLVGGLPLAHAGGRALWGDTVLDPEAGQVTAVGADDTYIWTARLRGGVHHLKAYRRDAPTDTDLAVSLFARPTAGAQVTRFYDARALPDGTVVTTTDAGLRLYHPGRRAWAPGPAGGGAHTRTYLLPDHLVLAEPTRDGALVSLIPRADIEPPRPDSDAGYTWTTTPFPVTAVAVDETRGEAAFLLPDGRVEQWKDNRRTVLLPPPGAAPVPGDLRRVFDHTAQNHLLFTTDSDAWSYDTVHRAWQRHVPVYPEGGERTTSLNLNTRDGRIKLTTRTASGKVFLGNVSLGDGSVVMQPLYEPAAAGLGADAADLLDVQGRAQTLWTFVLPDRIAFFDPRTRAWAGSRTLPGRADDVVYAQAAGLDVVSMNGGTRWLVAQDYRLTTTDMLLPSRFAAYQPHPEETTALDSNRRIWRLKPDGTLLRAGAEGDTAYTDFTVAAGPAFMLDPDTVLHAYDWNPYTVLETTDGLRIKHRETERDMPLSSEVRRHVPIRTARVFDKALWLHTDATLLRLERAGDDGLRPSFFTGVDRWVRDHAGTPWARINGAWQVWDGSRFRAPWTGEAATKQPGPAHVFVQEGSQATALDEAGRPFYWTAGFQGEEPPLDPEVAAGAEALFRGLDQDWWVVDGPDLIHVAPGYCRADDRGNMKRCLKETYRDLLPAGFGTGQWAQAGMAADGVLRLVLSDLRRVSLRETGDDAYALEEDRAEPLTHLLTDGWPTLRAHVHALPDGRTALDPILRLETQASGRLAAIRPSGDTVIADRGDVRLQQPEPLDVSWLRWDRTRAAFIVDTPKGKRTLTKSAFFDQGRFLFETVADVVLDDAGLHAANRHGLWHFPGESAALDATGVVFQPTADLSDARAVHTHFETADLRLNVDGRPAADTAVTVRFHDVALREANGGVVGTIQVGGAEAEAFAARGFAWDGARRGLFYENHRLILRSAAGFHPLDSLRAFDPGPPGDGPPGPAFADREGRLFVQRGTAWYARDDQGWHPAPDPLANRVLFTDAAWQWSLDAGRLRVQRGTQAYPLLDTSHGPAFAADLVRAAAFMQGRAYVMTEAGLLTPETAVPAPAPLPLTPYLPTTALAVFREPRGEGLYRIDGDEVTVFDSVAQTFSTPTIDPRTDRTLIDAGVLQVTLTGGVPSMSFTQQTPDGTTTRMPIALIEGRFPFDMVTAAASRGNELWLGTPIGLQYYLDAQNTGLGRVRTFTDLRRDTTGPPAAVTAMGRRPEDPDRILIASPGISMEIPPQAGPTPLAAAPDLSRRLSVQTPMWRWIQDGSGKVVGTYQDASGAYAGPEARLVGGRFPHDRIIDLAVWHDQAFTLWENGLISYYPTGSIALGRSVRHVSLAHLKPRALFTMPGTGPRTRKRPDLMLLLEDTAGAYYRYQKGQWEAVTDAVTVHGIREYRANPPIYQAERLRLRPGLQPVFEQRTRNGIWRPLAWQNGRVAIDRRHALATIAGTLWAATPEGLVSMDMEDGVPVLNPDTVTIIRELNEGQTGGQVTDLAEYEGRLVARINQDGKRLYEGTLDLTRDAGMFAARTGTDPFADRVLVSEESSGYWSWHLVGRSLGRRGYLKAELGGEVVRVVAGRFDFDTINSVALYKDGLMDLATDLGGWYRVARGELHVSDLQRPARSDINPLNITRVAAGREGDEGVLGLYTTGGAWVQLTAGSAPRETADFPEFQARDDLWLYTKTADGLTINALHDVGNAGKRVLQDGRFNDDTALGFPLPRGDGYLVPTMAGILELDAALKVKAVHTHPFPGLPDRGVPSVLLQRDGVALYAGYDAFYEVFGTRARVAGLGIAAPDNYRLESMERLAHGAWQALWRDGDQRGFTRLRGDDLATYPAGRMLVDLSRVPAFNTHRLGWGNPEPWLELDVTPHGVTARTRDGARAVPLPLPPGFQTLKPLRVGATVWLVGADDTLVVDLEHLVRSVYDP